MDRYQDFAYESLKMPNNVKDIAVLPNGSVMVALIENTLVELQIKHIILLADSSIKQRITEYSPLNSDVANIISCYLGNDVILDRMIFNYLKATIKKAVINKIKILIVALYRGFYLVKGFNYFC